MADQRLRVCAGSLIILSSVMYWLTHTGIRVIFVHTSMGEIVQDYSCNHDFEADFP